MTALSSSSCFLKANVEKQLHKERKTQRFCSWDQQSTTTANSTEEFDLPAKKSPSTCCSAVPRSLWLNQSLRDHAKKLGKIPLVPLNCTFGVVNPKPAVTLATALKQERKAIAKTIRSTSISIVFAVRHPGCVQCREHGQQLSELLKEDGIMHGIPAWGIVKDTKDQSLLKFYEDFFHFPLYMDSQWNVYKAMGGRRLSLVSAMKQYFMARRRWARKGICSQVSCGDASLQGGVLIFKRGKLRFAYEEVFGKELEVDDIRAAIQALREEDETQSTDSSVSLGQSFVSSRTEI
jgi:hypothetical protein